MIAFQTDTYSYSPNDTIMIMDSAAVFDGKLQTATAVTPEVLNSAYGFSTSKGSASVLPFPPLESGNGPCKPLARLRWQSRQDGADVSGKAVHVLKRIRGVKNLKYHRDRGIDAREH